MDFFERQEQARKGTKRLVVLFALAVAGIVVALNVIAFFVTQGMDEGEGPPPLMVAAVVTLGTLVLIGGASWFKTAQLHGDGGKVATMLGGRLVDPTSSDADERVLLNIVEEMSLASGMPVPDVYVLDRDEGINAFAAGSDLDNAAIGVTRGTLTRLTRDELQGVIAHEFSHALNGDMRLNIRLIGIIFGILVIGLLGYTCFRYAPYLMHAQRGRSSRDGNGGAALGIGLLAVGAAVWLVGSIGVFFGRLIQASVSRQREFLADASAVQFTRNPAGIRDALRRIGGNAQGATVSSSHAGECAHLFFASGFSAMFATHPPLPDRIKAVDASWDGSMLPGDARPPGREATRRAEPSGKSRGRDTSAGGPLGPPGDVLGGAAAGMSAGAATGRVGRLSPDDIEHGRELADALPETLRQAARRSDAAPAVVAALFCSEDPSARALQDEALARFDRTLAASVRQLHPLVRRAGPRGRLPLVELASPALRHLGVDGGKALLGLYRRLIEADRRVSPSEYALYKLVERVVLQPPVRETFRSVSRAWDEVATTLSAVASAGHPDDLDAAADAYARGVRVLPPGVPAFDPEFTLASLDGALETLAKASMPVKRVVLEAAAAVVTADGRVEPVEMELLRAVSAVWGCPMPPL